MNSLLLQNPEWLIQPEALQWLAIQVKEAAEYQFTSNKVTENSLLTIEDDIGVICIDGPILRRPDIYSKVILGATSAEEIGEALREAGNRPDIKAIFLDIDSPGGTVAGTPELAAVVAAVNKQKPVYAFTSGLMCSAAYWVASQARAIYATPSARVGSIGVVQAVIDNTAAIDKAGIKVEVFSVGKYKAMGATGTALTDDQRELIQSNLAEIAAEFHDAVLSRGRVIPASAMEGQTFSGKQAQQNNLAGMVRDREEAMRRLKVYHSAVDTKARVMTTTLEDQLLEARSQIDQLTRDGQAHIELHDEAIKGAEALRSEVALLTAELDALKTSAEEAQVQYSTVIEQRDTAADQVVTLQSQITDLEASQVDFDRKMQLEVARVVASTGTTMPARVTPAGDAQRGTEQDTIQDLFAAYDKLVTSKQPEIAAAFYTEHLSKHFNR